MSKRIFMLYSNSLFAAGVESLLRKKGEFDVATVVGLNCTEAIEQVRRADPELIIMDRGDTGLDCLLLIPQILQGYPKATIMCIDMRSENIDIYAKGRLGVSQTNELVEVLRNGVLKTTAWLVGGGEHG